MPTGTKGAPMIAERSKLKLVLVSLGHAMFGT